MQNLQSSLTGQFDNESRVDDDNQVDIDNRRGQPVFLIEFAIRFYLRLQLKRSRKDRVGSFRSALEASAPLGNSEY